VEFAARVLPTIAAGLDEAIRRIGPRGLMEWPCAPDVWHIIDWQQGRDDEHAIVSAEQGMLGAALDAAVELAEASGKSRWIAETSRWRTVKQYLCRAVRRQLWVPGKDAFADSLHADGTRSSVCSQPSNAILAAHGFGTAGWKKRLVRRIEARDPALLAAGSPMGLFYVLELLDQADRADAIFHFIREKWGTMIRDGDKTIWEHFPEFGHPRFPTRSRCHPFGTYILKYYAKYLMGIATLAPGWREFRFQPRPPQDVTSVEASLPTSRGTIRVGWQNRAGRIFSQIDHPNEMKRH
jgi:alpha-L-rhamnosidase